ncbi:hypothetical protein B9Z07_19130 [Burkholderia cenocepacia]|uniref:Uncharacterized protein n=1 Tax=Burkholderia cenocepacia TaxID=95486 RepID=A0AAD0J1N1_9BURK|nr:hypothetical protein B9Z07_19130 [Burkholderia cenocepacia]PRE35831.1 hypothetical protein C6P63_15765 [Burkholderia cenocepacia]
MLVRPFLFSGAEILQSLGNALSHHTIHDLRVRVRQPHAHVVRRDHRGGTLSAQPRRHLRTTFPPIHARRSHRPPLAVRGGTTSRGHDDEGRLLDVNATASSISCSPTARARPRHDAHAGDMAVTLDLLLTLHRAHTSRAVPRQIPWKICLRVHNIT